MPYMIIAHNQLNAHRRSESMNAMLSHVVKPCSRCYNNQMELAAKCGALGPCTRCSIEKVQRTSINLIEVKPGGYNKITKWLSPEAKWVPAEMLVSNTHI